MPQIAQQDHIRVNLTGDLSALTADEKKEIRDLHERGTLMDALFYVAGGDIIMRVVTDAIDSADLVIVLDSAGSAVVVDVSE